VVAEIRQDWRNPAAIEGVGAGREDTYRG
jgi:hypothetical protein